MATKGKKNDTKEPSKAQNTYSSEKLHNKGKYEKPSKSSNRENEDFSGKRSQKRNAQ